jgi:hypothetical protein
MGTPSSTLKQKVYRGIREYLFIALYLWLIFALFDVYKAVLLAGYHISMVARGVAAINALALAKIAVIARELKLDEHLRPEGKPLVYSTLLNSAAFAVLMALCKVLEVFAVGIYHHKTMTECLSEIGGSWRGIAALTGIFYVMLIPAFAFSELSVVIGGQRLRQIFFGGRHNS